MVTKIAAGIVSAKTNGKKIVWKKKIIFNLLEEFNLQIIYYFAKKRFELIN